MDSPWKSDAPPRDYAEDYEPEIAPQPINGALIVGAFVLGLFIGLIL